MVAGRGRTCSEQKYVGVKDIGCAWIQQHIDLGQLTPLMVSTFLRNHIEVQYDAPRTFVCITPLRAN